MKSLNPYNVINLLLKHYIAEGYEETEISNKEIDLKEEIMRIIEDHYIKGHAFIEYFEDLTVTEEFTNVDEDHTEEIPNDKIPFEYKIKAVEFW